MYIKFEIHIFAPPPFFFIYIFSPSEIYYNQAVRAAGEKFSAFFVQFCTFQVNWGKNMQFFTNWGKNMHFPPFFSPFNHFFLQPVIWPYKKSIHPCNSHNFGVNRDENYAYLKITGPPGIFGENLDYKTVIR